MCPSPRSFKFMASSFTTCYCMHICMWMYIFSTFLFSGAARLCAEWGPCPYTTFNRGSFIDPMEHGAVFHRKGIAIRLPTEPELISLSRVCVTQRNRDGQRERGESRRKDTKRGKWGRGDHRTKMNARLHTRDEKRVLVPGHNGKGDKRSACLMSVRSA